MTRLNVKGLEELRRISTKLKMLKEEYSAILVIIVTTSVSVFFTSFQMRLLNQSSHRGKWKQWHFADVVKA